MSRIGLTRILLWATLNAGNIFICSGSRSLGIQKIHSDITHQFSKLVTGEISLEDVTNCLVNFQETRSENLNIFYTSNAQSKKDIEIELQTLKHLIQQEVFQNMSINVMISLPYTSKDFVTTGFSIFGPLKATSMSYTNNQINLGFVLDLGKLGGPTCDDPIIAQLNTTINSLHLFKNEFQSSFVSNIEVGLGYDEICQVENCKQILNYIDLLLHNVKLGAFAESYGLFARTLEQVHEKNMKFLNNTAFPNPPLFYLLNFDLPTETNCLHNLVEFEKGWVLTKIDTTKVGIITPASCESSTNCPFSIETADVIPTIFESQSREDIKWYEGTALQTLKEKFDTVFLSHGQWEFIARSFSNRMGTLPNIIIDYSTVSTMHFNWKLEDEKLLGFSNNPNVTLEASLVIPVPSNEEVSKRIVDFSLKARSHSKIGVGCLLKPLNTWFSKVELQTSSKNCGIINGNFAIINIFLNMTQARISEYSYSHYIKNIQKPLNQISQARQLLASSNPKFAVYIYLETIPFPEIDVSYPTTVFCNENVLRANEYYEAILNWGKRNNFTIILKSVFDSIEKPHSSSWMSVLRPPYSFHSLTLRYPQLRTTQPIFVMRNYPKEINGWETDPCTPRITSGENIDSNFLRGNKTAAVFTMSMREASPISKEETQTMLQFIMHKFSAFEVRFTSPSEIIAFGEAFAPDFWDSVSKNNLTSQTKMFINYDMKDGQDPTPQQLLYINQIFMEFQRNTLLQAEGFHIHYSEVIKQEATGQLFTFTKLLQSATLNTFKVGVVIPGFCMDELQLAQLNKTSIFHKAVQGMRYIVCTQVVDVAKGDGMTQLGTLFDTHLYIKKLLNHEYPELGLYFKLKLDIDLGENLGQNMMRYKRFLKQCQLFGEAYDIQYFLVEAFDTQKRGGKKANGWWAISDYRDLVNGETYIEKEAYRVILRLLVFSFFLDKLRQVKWDAET